MIFRMSTFVVLLALALTGAAAQNAPGKLPRQATAPRGTPAVPVTKSGTVPVPETVNATVDVPIAPMSAEELPARAPHVTYRDHQLYVDSDNATLPEVLTTICKAMGAQIDLPTNVESDRVAFHLAGPARQVIAALLDDGKFGYVIVSSPEDPLEVQRLVLTSQSKDTPQAKSPAGRRVAAVSQPEPGPTPELAATAPESSDSSTEQTSAAAQAAQSQQQQQETARAAAAADAAQAQQEGKSANEILQDLYRRRQQMQQAQNQTQTQKPQQEQQPQ